MNYDIYALYIAAAVGGIIMAIFGVAFLSILWESIVRLWTRGDKIEHLERDLRWLKNRIEIIELSQVTQKRGGK